MIWDKVSFTFQPYTLPLVIAEHGLIYQKRKKKRKTKHDKWNETTNAAFVICLISRKKWAFHGRVCRIQNSERVRTSPLPRQNVPGRVGSCLAIVHGGRLDTRCSSSERIRVQTSTYSVLSGAPSLPIQQVFETSWMVVGLPRYR